MLMRVRPSCLCAAVLEKVAFYIIFYIVCSSDYREEGERSRVPSSEQKETKIRMERRKRNWQEWEFWGEFIGEMFGVLIRVAGKAIKGLFD
jgi:hypothetical protein